MVLSSRYQTNFDIGQRHLKKSHKAILVVLQQHYYQIYLQTNSRCENVKSFQQPLPNLPTSTCLLTFPFYRMDASMVALIGCILMYALAQKWRAIFFSSIGHLGHRQDRATIYNGTFGTFSLTSLKSNKCIHFHRV